MLSSMTVPNKKMTLVERALARRSYNKAAATPEEIELALAWVQGRVTMTQASEALYPDEPASGKVLYRIAVCLRAAYEAGRVQVAA
jgi:hypothetical protein